MDRLKDYESEITQEEQELFGTVHNPKYQQIVAILEKNPILVQPTINWLQSMERKLAATQLLTLYTPAQLKEKYTEEEWEEFKKLTGITE